MNKVQKKLIRKDFKKMVGGIHYLYYFENDLQAYELNLEPCMNGFEVALYRKDLKTRIYDLVTEKVCTNKPGYDKDILGIQERSQDTWDLALMLGQFMLNEYIYKKE